MKDKLSLYLLVYKSLMKKADNNRQIGVHETIKQMRLVRISKREVHKILEEMKDIGLIEDEDKRNFKLAEVELVEE